MAKAIYDLLRERIEMGRGEFPQLSWPGERPSLEVFVDNGSWLIFDLCGIEGKPEWLKIPSQHWKEFEEFRTMNTFVQNLPVINDSAERGMALIKAFIDKVHSDEDRQDLIQVIQNYRQKLKDLSKETLKNI